MGPIGRIIAIVAGLAGGTVFSQAPEFAQQYRQRIGGAIDELRVIVEDFNRQAAEHDLDRQQALNTYAQSSNDFLRDRGASMQSTIARYETLQSQQLKLGAAAAVAKPFMLMGEPDDVVFANTLRDFVPGVPISFAGLVWGAIGLSALGSLRRCWDLARGGLCAGGEPLPRRVESMWEAMWSAPICKTRSISLTTPTAPKEGQRECRPFGRSL